MEKVQTLAWVLLGLGGFLYRTVRKMRATSAQEARERPRTPAVPALPTATFQELLKQMQDFNTAEDRAPAAPATGQFLPPPSTAPRTLGGRPVLRPGAPVAHSQERKKPRLTSLEAAATARPINPPTPLVQRGANLPRAVVTAQPNAALQPFGPPAPAPEPTGATVRRLLAQPANVRAAFVLSEILGRRPW